MMPAKLAAAHAAGKQQFFGEHAHLAGVAAFAAFRPQKTWRRPPTPTHGSTSLRARAPLLKQAVAEPFIG
jgi:hypothetical protein